MPLTIPVIFGSVRRDRVGERVAKYAARMLTERGHIVTVVDPIEYPLPLLDKMYKEYPPSHAPELLDKLAKVVTAADAYVLVTAEYNHSVPPALVNMLDHFLEEYFFKPSAIIAYSVGPFGGVRAAVHLREMVAEMGMPAIPSVLALPKAHELFDAEGQQTGDRPGKSAARFFDELDWYANALKTARVAGTPY